MAPDIVIVGLAGLTFTITGVAVEQPLASVVVRVYDVVAVGEKVGLMMVELLTPAVGDHE